MGKITPYPKVQPTSRAKDILKEFPKLQSKITLKDNPKPTVTKLRSVPIAKREAVAAAVSSMVQQGIWEPVERSVCVHGMVCVPKADGGCRVTTDLSPLNKHVQPYRHPAQRCQNLFQDRPTESVLPHSSSTIISPSNSHSHGARAYAVCPNAYGTCRFGSES